METRIHQLSIRCLTALFVSFLVLSASASAQQKTPEPANPKVRAITAFINLERERYQIQISETVQFLKLAKTTCESRGFTVQTLRIATQPFPEYTKGLSQDQAIQFFKNLDGLAQQEHIVLAIGPADGWSAPARARASLLLSFGPITLPHELARVVLAEQLYRALTILAGHPYHSGH